MNNSQTGHLSFNQNIINQHVQDNMGAGLAAPGDHHQERPDLDDDDEVKDLADSI